MITTKTEIIANYVETILEETNKEEYIAISTKYNEDFIITKDENKKCIIIYDKDLDIVRYYKINQIEELKEFIMKKNITLLIEKKLTKQQMIKFLVQSYELKIRFNII